MTGLGGIPALVNLAHETGLLRDLDALLPAKERRRGYTPSTAAFDLMLIAFSGGECIDDLVVVRADQGLERLLHRKVMAPSTAHDFLRRIQYVGLEGLGGARRRQLAYLARTQNRTQATLDCDASLFGSRCRTAQMSYKRERGWMPVLAFWSELDLVVHEEFRQGAVAPQSDALIFLREAVAQLPDSHAGLRALRFGLVPVRRSGLLPRKGVWIRHHGRQGRSGSGRIKPDERNGLATH